MRIVKIRKKQGKDYFYDLCSECKTRYLHKEEVKKDVDIKAVIW